MDQDFGVYHATRGVNITEIIITREQRRKTLKEFKPVGCFGCVDLGPKCGSETIDITLHGRRWEFNTMGGRTYVLVAWTDETTFFFNTSDFNVPPYASGMSRAERLKELHDELVHIPRASITHPEIHDFIRLACNSYPAKTNEGGNNDVITEHFFHVAAYALLKWHAQLNEN
jgi:hypothetical protein